LRSVLPQSPSKLRAFLLALLVVFCNAVGNLALAWGMKNQPETVTWNPAGYVRAMLHPFVATGIVLLILWLLTRMALMSWADLSFALPLMSMGYVLAAVLGKFVLHEAVSSGQWLGTLLIFAGIGIVGTTDHRTEGAAGR
jgi:drug/metabolite transporter (DMT)-like permease